MQNQNKYQIAYTDHSKVYSVLDGKGSVRIPMQLLDQAVWYDDGEYTAIYIQGLPPLQGIDATLKTLKKDVRNFYLNNSLGQVTVAEEQRTN